MTPSLASVLRGIPMPVMIIDRSYRISNANRASVELFQTEPAGQSAVSLLRQAPVLAAIDAAIRDGTEGEARFIKPHVSGDSVYLFRAQPLSNAEGLITGAVLSFEDYSGVEAAEQVRRDFVSNISHELRTPLTGLIGFIETLRNSARDDPQARARFLEIMDAEAQRMARLVEDLMSLSRVEADERVRPRDPVDLLAVLRSVIATLEGRLSDAQVVVEVEGESGEMIVPGDRDQLIQVFLNLVENAIKYGGSDSAVTICVAKIARDVTLRCPAIRVDVRDVGPGIDPLHLPRLTERFYRVDSHRSREMGGTGLGLAIVKHIVNRHRGRLKIKSEQGVGSVFSAIFPSE